MQEQERRDAELVVEVLIGDSRAAVDVGLWWRFCGSPIARGGEVVKQCAMFRVTRDVVHEVFRRACGHGGW